ncbi:MAG TPA: SH3 domain-containing protein [Gemmatimonadaceae bacterium]|nr:SH3 domain-containing protein [Gemmatimonadaceae bacterium]
MTSPADTVRPMPGDEGAARTWVNVRAATGTAAEVLGVITPETRVRFGEAKGAWIRVSAAGLSGWVDRRLFTVIR